MKILLLGANGQLGTDIRKVFEASGRNLELLPVTRKDLDVSKTNTIRPFLEKVGFQALINCTSYHKTDELESHAMEAFTINAHAVKEMAESCEQKKARFIHISTDYVFDGLSTRPYVETDPTAPLNIYGSSKGMGEQLALHYCPQTFILRVASLFGTAGSSGKGGNFVETMIRIGKEKKELDVVNDITMSPTATAEVAKMISSLLEKEASPGIYHAVNSGQATWYEFAKQIIKKAGIRATVKPSTSTTSRGDSSKEYPTKALRPKYSVLNNSKVASCVGTIPHWSESLDLYLRERGALR
ncbi:MAG: dTDP-4-dehydrorhamnose reductase [Deltaproteobacteria bacterium]|nr:dTDP-4-dehydrorhamnose reductase [Deltaproteobacteria bacterium]